MAFIILGDAEQEWERRPLRQAMTIGRSFDCELPVRDTLLSRKHCRLEPHGNQWVLIDLKSRNGTRVGQKPVTRHILEEGDVIRIGQTLVCFRAGPFVAAPAPSFIPSRCRPLDPLEAMAATISGAELAAAQPHIPGFPTPKPRPTEPKAFQKEGIEKLVSTMASGIWDSRLANQALARRPALSIPWPDSTIVQAQPKTESSKIALLDLQKPARWLVILYLTMAGTVFMASLCAIAWPGI
jgi:predicted component of type VI protein secretion system